MTGMESQIGPWPFARRCPLDPPPELAELREVAPLARVPVWDGSSAWLATSYAYIKTLLGDPRMSSVTTKPNFPHANDAAAVQREGQKTFVRMDPPEHDRQRLMLTGDFMVRHVRALEPFLDDLLDGIFTEMERSGRPVDLVATLAEPVPAQVISRMLDLPTEMGQYFLDRVKAWMSLDDSAGTARAAEDILNYFDELITQREANPGDDLVSRLVHQHMLSGDISRYDLKHMLHLLLIGGFDTTANMIALGTLVLLKHPDQLDEVRRDPSLIKGVVEELLRYLTVAHFAATRVADQDVEIAGQCVRAGDGVIAPLMAANRDPVVFPEPDTFDVHRDARAHLAFGFGVHQCLGQALARVELQVVFRRLLERFPTLRLAVDESELKFLNATIYGVESLPVTW